MKNLESPTLPLVVIVGPTASGKSALALALAKTFSAEIMACDSTQLYRGVDIGTAKPPAADRRQIPHHLMDILEPSEVATAGAYRDLALQALTDLRERERLPILTVGTGLYMRALLEGLADLPLRSEEVRARLRESVSRHGAAHLHKVLQKMDHEAAKKIAPADEQKLIRAIEVCVLTRKPITEVHRAGRNPLQGWRVLKVGLLPDREDLYRRIAARTDAMIAAGWLDEVKNLLAAGIAPEAKVFDFIGYREMLAVARQELTIEQARATIQQATRNYAKRQMTWFRKDTSTQWFSGAGDHPGIQREITAWLSEQLAVRGRA
jgi:tRNA dimethylallyltransferase